MFGKLTKVLLAAALVLALALPGVANAGPKEWPTTLKLGFIPTEGAADSAKRAQPIAKQLEKDLGVKVEVFTASDYNGIITAMANGHIDLAYYGPKSYVEASEKANADAVVMELNKDGQPGYTGLIITRKDSGITDMEKAKGKTFAFTDPNSTSGYLVPNVIFARDMKVDPEKYFKEIRFSGSHGASILAVKNGSVEVAATNNIDLDRMIEKGSASLDDFNVIKRSDLIPGAPIAVRKDLPASLKVAIAGSLLNINDDPEALQVLQNGGYRHTNDKDYDMIRYLKRLKAELAKKK
ncbi:MAG: phosphonate ABC transporter substrate-binding protein [Pseudodesulfovibrio sp.]|jgi:phosphonate transport system substrate-binding protein|uniref:Phosphonate ABC transporter substrate-binding protein n=1 Tax=Pseudodesulfovibrio indicus TaxID=1716143 RepID=A0A126QLD1_9BACT|nr:phosphonate ABC transporter substrate-binding protein [Pseudodesulfovibrio indicus]AMK10215.1 phosphonate ABC transporter substrate-binding protein [Pseudodesulfovibrio indicus]TDT87923.1 phosphonate transport system substrate-binding protein [Pseudodesulfovibrio indicus]